MNKLNEEIKSAMNSLSPSKDITAAAEKRAARQKISIRRYRTAAAVICALTVMCGTAVSAVKLGWLSDMLGTTEELFEDTFARINVSTENFTFEKTESAPADMDFILLDAVSDGETLIVNYRLSGISSEDVFHSGYYESAKNDENTPYVTCTSQIIPLSDGTYGHTFSTNLGINSGDRIRFELHSCESGEPLGKAFFDIGEDVPRLAKDIAVGKTATVRDKSKDYVCEKTFVVDSITLSALNLKINYLAGDNSNNSVIGKDITITMTDGQIFELESLFYSYETSTDLPKNADGLYKQHITVETGTVIDPDAIECVTIGDLTIPVKS